MYTNFVSTFKVHKYYKPKKAILALTILTLMLLITTIFTTTPIMAQTIPNNTALEIPSAPLKPTYEELITQAIPVNTAEGLRNAIATAENGKNTIFALTQDIQLTATLTIPSNKNITLMSNNQATLYKLINDDNTVTIFVDDEGFLVIYSIIVTHVEDATGSGVQVNKEGTLIMMGGEISSNTATNGGGIYNMGTFIMCDGSISNNIAIRDGAGIYNLDSTFEMFNGKILDNKAITGDRVTSCGGGVYSKNSIFNMYDGEISRNSADDGGGVYSAGVNAKFAMYGGIIGGSVADKNMARSDGGGVYNSLGIFEMYDGEISYNEANTVPLNSGGGGVYTFGTFEMFGGIISNNKVFSLNNADGGYSGGGVLARDIFNMWGGEISGNDGHMRGGGVSLYGDICDSFFTMYDGKISGNTAGFGGGVHIDINTNSKKGGFTMWGGEISGNIANNNVVNTVKGSRNPGYGGGVCGEVGDVILEGGKISGNTALYGGGVFNYAYGTFIMNDGIIGGSTPEEANTASIRGGGVYNLCSDIFMHGGKILGNTAPSGGGVGNQGIFTLSGGEISNNKATYGGGVYNIGHERTNSFFTILDGEISNNFASYGGGIYNSDTLLGDITISGGKISENVATNNGGGLYVSYSNLNKVTVGAGVVFSYNHAATLHDRDPLDNALYEAQIAEDVTWTSPAIQGYNNYDISYTAGRQVSFFVNVTHVYPTSIVGPESVTVYDGKYDLSKLYRPVAENGQTFAVTKIVVEKIVKEKYVTITYHPGLSGTGGLVDEVLAGSEYILKNSNEAKVQHSNPRFNFRGWSTDINGFLYGSNTFYAGQRIIANEDLTLYAQWIMLTRDVLSDGGFEVGVGGVEGQGASSSIVPLGITFPNGDDSVTVYDEGALECPLYTFDVDYLYSITIYYEELPDDPVYNIDYILNGGVNAPGNPYQYVAGDLPLIIDVPVRENYVFFGWKILYADDTVDMLFANTIPVGTTGDITLEAMWTTQYTIEYELNGGVNAEGNPVIYTTLGLPLDIANPSKENFVFLGWTVRYANGSSITVPPANPYTIPVGTTGDILLTALWIASDVEETLYYTITYHGNGHTDGTVPIDTNNPYVSGSVVIIRGQGSLVKEGYRFTGWTTNPNTNTITHAPGATFTILSDTVLYAVWEEIPQQQYTVTYRPGAHGTFVEKVVWGLLLDEPTPQPPTVTGEAGWKFTGWSPTPTETVEGDAVYVAQWEQEVFTVVFKDWDGTVLKTQEVLYGGAASAPANPSRSGYTFTGWDRPFNNIVSDLTITAQYTQTGTGGGGGSGGRTSKNPTATTISPPPTTTSPNTTPPPTNTPPTGEEEVVAVWALVNLVLSVVGVILAIILTICVLLQRKQKQEEQEQENAQRRINCRAITSNEEKNEEEVKRQRQRRLFWFAVAIITSIASIIVFVLTEDMSLPRVMVDKWTIVNAILFIVELVAIALVFKRNKNNSDNEDNTAEKPKP